MLVLSLFLNRAAGVTSAPNTAESGLQLTDAYVRDDALILSWAGGRPAYQVQTRTTLLEPWSNVGGPTTDTAVMVPLNERHAIFRVLADYTARYEVIFDATWSQTTHPQDWPAPGHWSGLVGAVHNDRVQFFQEGQTASEGIRLMAERGQQDTLLNEVAPALQSGAAQFQLRGQGISVSPGMARLTFPEPVRRDWPLVTLCSMVAPSPDWFVGVAGLGTCWRTALGRER
ncbi:MAG: spondin domain-containing protein [Verrucomicrobiota bacterium]